jgi:hypothetical protein
VCSPLGDGGKSLMRAAGMARPSGFAKVSMVGARNAKGGSAIPPAEPYLDLRNVLLAPLAGYPAGLAATGTTLLPVSREMSLM